MADSYPRSRRNYEENESFRDEFGRSYEPSAPPYHIHEDLDDDDQRYYPSSAPNDFDEFPHSRHEEQFYSREPREPREPREREPLFGRAEDSETLGGYLVTRLLRPLWRGSHSVVRVDLRRSIMYDGPVVKDERRRHTAPRGTVASSGGADYYDDEPQGPRGWLNGISGGGTRFKFMQIWDAPDIIGEARQHWNLTVGGGVNVELDKGYIEPKIRVKAKHVALHLLPRPEVEVRGKWPLGNTRLAINAKYRVPLVMSPEDMWNSSGARLMINFFNPLGSGFHLTPGGLEFDEHLIRLGEHTKLRFAAALEFPRKLPVEEGEQPFKVRVHRLGIKTVIKPGVTVYRDERGI